MELDGRLKALAKGDTSQINKIANLLGQNSDPSLLSKTGFYLEGIKQQRPDIYNEAVNKIVAGQDWTKSNGGAEQVLNGLKGVTVEGSLGAGAKIPGAKADAGVGITLKPDALIDTKLNETASTNRGFTALKNMTQPPAGVATELPDDGLDRGTWRFV